MKVQKLMILIVLAFGLLLCACGAQPEVQPTEAPTEPAEIVETVPQETEDPATVQAADVVMPTEDAASGTLLFYFEGGSIHAGGPMSDMMALNHYTETDLDQLLQPGHLSDVIRFRMITDGVSTDDQPMVFLVAFNTAAEPQKISDCLIYSVSVNTDSGISFGSDNETEAFVTGVTTRDQIITAYGEPSYANQREETYKEMAYYKPFNCAYFSFKNNVVRQIVTYYSANVYGELAESFTGELGSNYYGADCRILMSQYLDVAPYQTNTTVVGEKLAALEESIIMDGQTIELGVKTVDMPEPFGSPFQDLLMPLGQNCYIRTGRTNEEEFFVINRTSVVAKNADQLSVKGVITENRNYVNWGEDGTVFHEFAYGGLTQDATIEEILAAFGQPRQMQLCSSGRLCYAWMFYEDEAGNQLQLRVDPMTDQLIELRLIKYFKGERADG